MSSVPDDETSSLLNPRKQTGKFEKILAKSHFSLCE